MPREAASPQSRAEPTVHGLPSPASVRPAAAGQGFVPSGHLCWAHPLVLGVDAGLAAAEQRGAALLLDALGHGGRAGPRGGAAPAQAQRPPQHPHGRHVPALRLRARPGPAPPPGGPDCPGCGRGGAGHAAPGGPDRANAQPRARRRPVSEPSPPRPDWSSLLSVRRDSGKMHQLSPLSCVAERFVALQKRGRQAEVSARKISGPLFVSNARKYLLGKQSL